MSKARQLADLGNVYDDGALSNRSMVVNGAMTVSQRGNSTGVTTAGYYGPDRFQTVLNSAGTWSVSQTNTAPDGFGSSFKFDCTTADASLSTGDYLVLYYNFEGQDLQRLKKGTSSAEKSTLSFWIRSNKTGTYQVNMQDQDNSRLTGKTYTIDAADTWEHKVITFDGDTTGAYTNDANASMNLEWWFAAGSTFTSGAVPTSWEAATNADRAAGLNVNLADSTSNELYITGVQLELGDTATPFEHRSYGDELARCQRYYYKSVGGAIYMPHGGVGLSFSTGAGIPVYFPVDMRATPSFSTSGAFQLSSATTGYAVTSFTLAGNQSGNQKVTLNAFASGTTATNPYRLENQNSAASNISFDAEL